MLTVEPKFPLHKTQVRLGGKKRDVLIQKFLQRVTSLTKLAKLRVKKFSNSLFREQPKVCDKDGELFFRDQLMEINFIKKQSSFLIKVLLAICQELKIKLPGGKI